MRFEKVISNLVDASENAEVNPAKLARVLQLTIKKIEERSPAGAEATRIVQSNILREALNRDLAIKRVRRRKDQTEQRAMPARGSRKGVARKTA